MILSAVVGAGIIAGALVIAQTAPPDLTAGQAGILWGGFGAIPIVMGVIEALKQAGLPSRWAGVVSIALGALGGVVFGASLDAWRVAVPQGLYVGLAASGLYSVIKAGTHPHPSSSSSSPPGG